MKIHSLNRNLVNSTVSWGISILIVIGLWMMASSSSSASYYFPSFQALFQSLSEDPASLSRHFLHTLKTSVIGFVLGATAAIVASLVAMTIERSRRLFSITAIAIYSVPLIAAAPLAALIFGSDKTGVVLACIGSFLPVYLAGLRASDKGIVSYQDILSIHGASKKQVVRLLRVPFAARGWIVGARSGWLWAVLGALLGDLTGSRWGLGTFLLGSLTRGDPARIWVIVVLCVLITFVGLVTFYLIGKSLKLHGTNDVLEASLPIENKASSKSSISFRSGFGSLILFFAAWQFLTWVFPFDGGVFSSPIDLAKLSIEIFSGEAAVSYPTLLNVFSTTWALALVGVLLSISIASVMAAGQLVVPIMARPASILLLITQVTPIVAFVPFIAFYVGRGAASVITIVILSTIYPSYVILYRALKDVPVDSVEIVRVFGGKLFSEFMIVRLPQATWMSIIAFRLAISRAMLGAVTAEYFITGQGVGGLLGQTRAFLDFRIVWLVCFLIAASTLFVDVMVSRLSELVIKRKGMFKT